MCWMINLNFLLWKEIGVGVSDFMIVDDLVFRDSFYWKNLIEEKIRVILYFFYFV